MINWYLTIALLLAIIFGGYEHFSYKQYRAQVEAQGKQAEIKAQEVKKEQELATKGIEDAYKSKINTIRVGYDRLHDTRSSSMSTIPNTTIRFNDATANMVLAEQCAETTQQLISMQDWIKLQAGIK